MKWGVDAKPTCLLPERETSPYLSLVRFLDPLPLLRCRLATLGSLLGGRGCVIIVPLKEHSLFDSFV